MKRAKSCEVAEYVRDLNTWKIADLELRFEALKVMGKIIIIFIDFELIFKISAQEKKNFSIN